MIEVSVQMSDVRVRLRSGGRSLAAASSAAASSVAASSVAASSVAASSVAASSSAASFLAAGLLAASCLVARPLAAQKAPAAARCAGVADFVDLVGGDTISVSRVVVTDTTFESRSRAVAQGALLRFSGRRTAAGDLGTLHIEMWPVIADSAGAPAQIVDVNVQDGDVVARVAAPARGMQMQHDRLPAGGVLYMANVPLFLELMQRRVRVAVGATATVPALWLFTGGAVDTVEVSRPSPDSLRLRFRETDFALALAPDHSILGATSRPRPGVKGEASRLVRRDCR